ncbi:hypothetical protein GCM10010104_27190 [Streptomyces indiaensis]|uniref:Uncharacterized protein n=1 Tax=Streptomyces indiaensis TaxID=284033 RepID=A0ABN3DHY1_9ACTN
MCKSATSLHLDQPDSRIRRVRAEQIRQAAGLGPNLEQLRAVLLAVAALARLLLPRD